MLNVMMPDTVPENVYNKTLLSDVDFSVLSTFIEKSTGIKMPESKRVLMQSRLLSRLKACGYTSFSDYISFVFSASGIAERTVLVDSITTNLTEFFRESEHFDYLSKVILPEFSVAGATFKTWSAGCSTGQEPYTLCMVIDEFIRTHATTYSQYSVYASDLSTKVLRIARDAVYPADLIARIPQAVQSRYFTKSRDQETSLVRLKPSIRSHVTFRHLNFMDSNYNVPHKMHVIFCRNVLIYFDKENQESIIRRLISNLEPGGYLFLGHSETIMGMNLPLKTVSPTVFKKIKEGS